MSFEGKRFISENMKSGTICIDSYEDKIMSGRLWYPHFAVEKEFHGLMQLLLLIEKTHDEMEFPGAYAQSRTFKTGKIPTTAELVELAQKEKEVQPGKIATLKIKIIFRQNASWQGVLSWIEGGREESFRSALEFIFLADSTVAE